MFPTSTLTPDLGLLEPKIAPLVNAINDLGLPTYASCEGHDPARGIQSPMPYVIITPKAGQGHAPQFLRFMGMLGMHNNSARYEEVQWLILPDGNPYLSFTLKPVRRSTLIVMHSGIDTLVQNLRGLMTWYEPR